MYFMLALFLQKSSLGKSICDNGGQVLLISVVVQIVHEIVGDLPFVPIVVVDFDLTCMTLERPDI